MPIPHKRLERKSAHITNLIKQKTGDQYFTVSYLNSLQNKTYTRNFTHLKNYERNLSSQGKREPNSIKQ